VTESTSDDPSLSLCGKIRKDSGTSRITDVRRIRKAFYNTYEIRSQIGETHSKTPFVTDGLRVKVYPVIMYGL